MGIKVNKIETSTYGAIFDVELPARFYFTDDGEFDGIEFECTNASERDMKLLEELLLKLAAAGVMRKKLK